MRFVTALDAKWTVIWRGTQTYFTNANLLHLYTHHNHLCTLSQSCTLTHTGHTTHGTGDWQKDRLTYDGETDRQMPADRETDSTVTTPPMYVCTYLSLSAEDVAGGSHWLEQKLFRAPPLTTQANDCGKEPRREGSDTHTRAHVFVWEFA